MHVLPVPAVQVVSNNQQQRQMLGLNKCILQDGDHVQIHSLDGHDAIFNDKVGKIDILVDNSKVAVKLCDGGKVHYFNLANLTLKKKARKNRRQRRVQGRRRIQDDNHISDHSEVDEFPNQEEEEDARNSMDDEPLSRGSSTTQPSDFEHDTSPCTRASRLSDYDDLDEVPDQDDTNYATDDEALYPQPSYFEHGFSPCTRISSLADYDGLEEVPDQDDPHYTTDDEALYPSSIIFQSAK